LLYFTGVYDHFSDWLYPQNLKNLKKIRTIKKVISGFFEKEKDAEGNTQNIWNTHESLARAIIFVVPTLMILLHWFFHWNIQQHSIFFVFAIYLFMYYFPSFFRGFSVYRIVIDLAILLVCI
jgi:uncharacterized membrane protein